MHACFESRETLYLVNHGIDEAVQGVQVVRMILPERIQTGAAGGEK
jgi:hypothetical protein